MTFQEIAQHAKNKQPVWVCARPEEPSNPAAYREAAVVAYTKSAVYVEYALGGRSVSVPVEHSSVITSETHAALSMAA